MILSSTGKRGTRSKMSAAIPWSKKNRAIKANASEEENFIASHRNCADSMCTFTSTMLQVRSFKKYELRFPFQLSLWHAKQFCCSYSSMTFNKNFLFCIWNEEIYQQNTYIKCTLDLCFEAYKHVYENIYARTCSNFEWAVGLLSGAE